MQSVLEEMYSGNIRPDSRRYAKDSPFMEAVKFRQINQDKLKATLNEYQLDLLEKYDEAQGDIQSITRYDTFTYALKLGILLMVEVFTGNGEITGED